MAGHTTTLPPAAFFLFSGRIALDTATGFWHHSPDSYAEKPDKQLSANIKKNDRNSRLRNDTDFMEKMNMRLPLLTLGMILALTLIVTGCGGGTKTETPAPAPENTEPDANSNDTSGSETARGASVGVIQVSGQTSHPSQEVVLQFLTEILKGNTPGAFALFTPKAQQEYIATNSSLDPQWFQGMEFRIVGGDVLPNSDGKLFGVHVNMVSGDEIIPTVWCVRQIGNEYRIANLMMSLVDEDNQNQFVTLDFEDPVGTRTQLLGESAEQQASANQTSMNNQPAMQQPQQQLAQPNMPNVQ